MNATSSFLINVENESGLSNFIPILIGDKEVCPEFRRLEQELVKSLLCCRSKSEHVEGGKSDFDICRLNLLKWQKSPGSISRHRFLINGRSLALTAKVLHSPEVFKILGKVYEKSEELNDVDAKLLQEYVKHARPSLSKKPVHLGFLASCTPSKTKKGEIMVEVVIGDAWRIVFDACLSFMHPLDARRCIPYSIHEAYKLLGIPTAFQHLLYRDSLYP
eukprot:Gb_12892 [translate_table: standard]